MQNSVDLLTMLCSKSENHTLEKFENVHSVETHQNKRKRRKECQRGLSSEQPDGHRLIKRMYRVEDLQRDLYGMNKYDLQLAKRFANATCSSYADVSLRIQHKTAKSTDPLVEKKRSSSTVAMAKQILDSNEQSILQSHLYEQKHASSIQTPKQAKIIQVIEEKKSNSINSYLPSKFSVKTTTTQQTVQSSQYKKQSSDAILQMSNQHTDQELTITEKSSLHRTLCRTDMTKSMPIISSTENENNAQISSEEPHTKFESGDHEIYRVNVATQWSKQSLEKVEDILNKSSIMTIDDADGKNQTPKFHFDELNKTPLNSTISTELSCCDLKRSSDVYLSNSATKNDASYDDQNSSNMRKNDLDYTIVDRHKISSEKNVKDSVRIQSTEGKLNFYFSNPTKFVLFPGYVRLNDYTVVYACSNVTQQSTKVPLNSPNTSVQQLLINSEQILQDLNIPTCECSIENLVKNIDGKNITRVSLNSFSTIENLIQHKKRVKNKIMHAPIKVQSKRTARQRRQTISNRKQQQNKRRRLSKQLPLTNNKKNEKELEDSSSFDFFDFDTLTSKSYDHLFASNSENLLKLHLNLRMAEDVECECKYLKYLRRSPAKTYETMSNETFDLFFFKLYLFIDETNSYN
ncbi:unnamed protein product [Didymodactylos carnosus]|uniref:Uncharacterized protein n=1 Tax=Didymodactylos carnosus TaxID=1234261 RepID=A0A8S2EZ01_9BILA|nr:unnamed protein product [Didymodactylos carnosus]CAF4101473.1 unnamed protein product [Didymodactylos carnosus]